VKLDRAGSVHGCYKPRMRRLNRDDLVAWIEAGCTPREGWRLGVEWEKELVDSEGRRLPFFGPGGIEELLTSLVDCCGWTPELERGHPVALGRSGEAITLEPGGQLEYSCPPQRSAADAGETLRAHLAELRPLLATGQRALSTSYPPLQDIADIGFVPKARYDIMGPYLLEQGALAHGMMKGTTSLQVTADFSSEEDCGRKLDVALGLAPVAMAITANSPLVAGARAGVMSHRGRCWRATDPARTGLLAGLTGRTFSFEAYVDWIVDVPMMFYVADGAYLAAHGRTFRQWMDDGIDGVYPDESAWQSHLTSVFPEARVKNFVEVRSMENGPLDGLVGAIALWAGLLYDEDALAGAHELVSATPPEQRDRMQTAAIVAGLADPELQALSTRVLALAEAGLRRQGEDDSALDPLRRRVESGRSPAMEVLDAWDAHGPGDAFLDAISY
jgi:glutamate--cysteine ligase